MYNDRELLGNSDEVDLIELVRVLLCNKLLIISLVAFFAVGSIAYVLLVTPVYEARVMILPPSQSDISHLNYGRGGTSGLAPLSAEDVYRVYLNNLRSESLRRKFFREVYLSSLGEGERNSSQDGLYRRFNELLAIEVESKERPSSYVITARLSDPQQVARWVVLYAQMAGAQAKNEVLKDVKGDAIIKANNLQQQVVSAQYSARKQREDQIAKLEEALTVARSIGLEKPLIISGTLSAGVSAGMDGSLTYMRGSKALEAEIDNLEKRASDDPFIEGLRQKQAAVASYRNLGIDPSVVAVYRQDGDPELPDQPIEPRKALIVLIGGLFGMLSGVVLVLVRHFWRIEARRSG
ncbi:LPS O-antigen chain length determinant protein WzzB [Pseudomonas sp. 5P_5.1_Bac1]|uniref:LPS O-antigen chain length determinant protein WzzB n=1 Tax=Pseudomonas sp. 5P_5.1_Bac1 TaxID=2971616 RepID=UPI0021C9A5EA|nr:Wzz/FepE/Etk N-terminal domain-containing protein [Pseudomonas sp. 5P_5.1_Bac1]MCU1722220.1 Wzz/FepE/Etk N-terminal domain-containing protein [Pseudomonas sp. 5P_5.1_Bac1]